MGQVHTPHSLAQQLLLWSDSQGISIPRALISCFQVPWMLRCWWGYEDKPGEALVSDSAPAWFLSQTVAFVLGVAPFTTTLHGPSSWGQRYQFLLMTREPASSYSLPVTPEVRDFNCLALFLNYPLKWAPCIDPSPSEHRKWLVFWTRSCILKYYFLTSLGRSA